MSIVSNATPLIYLAKVGKLDLLRIIFKEILIPEEVKIEVVDRGKQLKKRCLRQLLPSEDGSLLSEV